MFAWAMAAYRHSPVIYFAPGIWSLLMYLIQIILAVALIRCVQQTGAADFLGIRQWQGIEPVEHLMTDGFYAFVRHPLYLLSILFLLLNPVMTLQWLILTIFSTLYFILGAIIEERRLIEVFGDSYRRYRETVPFIIPGKRRNSHQAG
jgi:protein-S-isoprenylcysteine O-methyltransferase Ste14